MEDILVYPAGTGEAILYAQQFLNRSGIATIDHPSPDISHLLLDIPSSEIPVTLLERLPEEITVVGGNLDQPELSHYKRIDFLRREAYLAKNAAITADCALRIAAKDLKTVFADSPALVIGWGRIGKCLSALLKGAGCCVTVAARKESDRAILNALGYKVINPAVSKKLDRFLLIFNTAPEPVLDKVQLSNCSNALKIDLASRRGLIGNDVIWARGLPGQYAPESSGMLIAETLLKEVMV